MIFCRLREGLKGVLNMSKFGNQYIQSNQPWVLVKGSESDRYEMCSPNYGRCGALMVTPRFFKGWTTLFTK